MFVRNCTTETEICFVFLRLVRVCLRLQLKTTASSQKQQAKAGFQVPGTCRQQQNNWLAFLSCRLSLKHETKLRQSLVTEKKRRKWTSECRRWKRRCDRRKWHCSVHKSTELAWRQFLWAYHISKPYKYSPPPTTLLEINFQSPPSDKQLAVFVLASHCVFIDFLEGFCLWQNENEKGW